MKITRATCHVSPSKPKHFRKPKQKTCLFVSLSRCAYLRHLSPSKPMLVRKPKPKQARACAKCPPLSRCISVSLSSRARVCVMCSRVRLGARHQRHVFAMYVCVCLIF